MSPVTRQTPAGRAYLDLQNLARRRRRGTQELLILYVVERWLARLSASKYRDDFILKGGMLLAAFGNRRPTADADTLARNMARDADSVASRIADIAAIEVDDGVDFLTGTVATRSIREDALYQGIRVTMTARIATAHVKLRLDINFGDPVTPAPEIIEVPALRPVGPPIHVLGYPIETVLAEKIATAIELGAANTRVRDYADIHVLVCSHDIRYDRARDALVATAGFRGTALTSLAGVIEDLVELRGRTYRSYREELAPDNEQLPVEFSDLIASVVRFADPLIVAAPGLRVWLADRRAWAS